MKNVGRFAALCLAVTVSMWMTACTNGSAASSLPPIITTPGVTVSPAALAIASVQALKVEISLSGAPVPTGTVTLTSGSYTSAATTLQSGSASINIPAGSLSLGSNTLTATYTPDSGSSSLYYATTGASPAVAVVMGTITVNQASTGPAVTDQILGMNMPVWYDPTTPAIVPALATAGIRTIRWPGGKVSDLYHWATNTVCSGTTSPNSQFATFASDLAIPASVNVEFVADYGTNAACTGPGEPAEAAALVSAALADNVSVNYVVVGNEEHGNWEEDLHPLPHDPTTYANAVKTGFYPALKAANPNVQVGVDVDIQSGTGSWDSIVLPQATFDFVDFHYYAEQPGNENDTPLVMHAALDMTHEINVLKSLMAQYGRSGTPIQVGEISSVENNPGKQTSSITQALFAGQALGEMMNDGIVRATWWLGFGGCDDDPTVENFSSSLYGWQNFGGYMVFSDGLPDPECASAPNVPAGTLLPTARAFQLFSSVAVTGEHVLTSSIAGDTTNVRAYAVTHSGGTALVLFNLNENASEPVAVILSGQTASAGVTVQTYSKAIYDLSQNNVWAPPTSATLGAQSIPLTLTLAPWSMNVVILK
jgi:hypothetical protein